MYEINKKSTRAEVLAAVKEDGYALSRANTQFRDDKVIVIASIKWNPESIKYASDRIKKDKKIILKTVSLNGNSLKYVSKELKKNKDIVQAAYKSAGEDVLEYADKGIKKKIITAIRKKEEKNRLIAEKKRKKEEDKIKKDYKDVIKFIEKNAIKERNDIYKHLNINNLQKLLDKLIATHKNIISSYDLISCFCPKEINKKKFFRYMTDNLGSADFYHHSIKIFDRDLDQVNDITLAEKLLILINSGLKFIPVFNFKNYFFIDHYQKYIKKNKKYLFKQAIEMDYVEPKYDKGAISYNINDYNEDEIDAVIENFLGYLSDAGEGYSPGNYYFRLLSIKDNQYLIFISEEFTIKNSYHEIRVIDSSSNYTKTELRKLIVSTINNYVPHVEQIPKIKASEIDLNVLFDIDHYFRNDTGEDLYVEDNLSD